ncbi:cellulose biosynthesis protein BcsE [Pseudoalteromonas sp. SG45-5]|uniref:cellulose biosynthesis protein BcsE n=1 Tax=unclassified Pseudoalteromonas TaxID=194690 RepID=UPI0015FDA2A7|nr:MULTISPECIES: cellulose biosynthesis protein BcsE [unclassified Pseudoalteromonas]MBB1384027.1 cellulose biosynthesis protein BcsE [Pseudoalteromonas sp. SG45-5]MBB1392446.1 cellulose biosynthesis protein BcsE [Pseudoalteromonas sp. SG44-4]MBB1448136.1 cellulose biosynthesis protein BcsE [Pseudoalteromonas sp. SG41-6]
MHKLNITGLDAAANEIKLAASYAILAPFDNLAVEFALQSVDVNGKNDVFIVSSQIESFYESPFSDALFDVYDQGRVHSFSFTKEMTDWGIKRISRGVIKELGAYKSIENALVFLHFNTKQLRDFDDAQLMQIITKYNVFLNTVNTSLLFLISGPEVVNLRFLVRRLNKLFSGIVFIDNDAAVRVLEYDYWSHSTGVIADKQYQLTLQNNQYVVQENKIEENTFNNNHFNDESDVWLVQSSVPEGTKLPAHYRTVKENNDLFNRGPRLKAATLVFSVTRYTDLALLAKQCFELRKNCGRWLKLVIQNVDGIIRHQDECLFLTLGVNLILYSFSEPSRLLSQIQSIQGFKFSRPLPPSVDDVLQYTENTFSKGYLPFIDFTNQVEKHSDSAVNLGVSGVLVILELLPRIDPIHPLHLFHIKREGDVFSVVDNKVYLYLHACRENDVTNAINHLFKLQTSDFFSRQNIISDHFYIQQECKQLRRFYKDKQIDDFTKQLKENEDYKFVPDVTKNLNIDISTPELLTEIRPDAIPFVMKMKEQ